MMCSRLVSTTRPIATLFMLRMVSRMTAKASWPTLRLIWLKLTFSVSDVAGYRATGQVTSERRKKPFQFARGAMGYSEYAADDRPRYHRGTRIQGERGGNLATALTGVGPVGCKRTPSAGGACEPRPYIGGAKMSSGS